MTAPKKDRTTAETLGQFRKELIGQGFPHEQAETIATEAYLHLIRTGEASIVIGGAE